MEFRDDDVLEPDAGPTVGGPRGRGPTSRRQQVVVRRLVAVGLAALLLLLIILGVKGCLNARKQRGFESYVSGLTTYVAQTKQLSSDFFGRLSDPGRLGTAAFQAEVSADRGTAEGLLTNVESLSTPDELQGAQQEVEEAFTLRRDGLAGIAANIKPAVGGSSSSRNRAFEAIANYMRYFVASDVVYARAENEIDQVLAGQGVEIDGKPAKAPTSVFMSDPLRWLDPLQVGTALAALSAAHATPGTHGLALLQTTVKPGDVLLSPDAPVTVTGNGPYEVDVSVQNQGDVDEKSVFVSVEVTGGTETISGTATIPKIVPQGTQTIAIPVRPTPPAGQEVSVAVTVFPVPGEEITTNNQSTYQVTFGH